MSTAKAILPSHLGKLKHWFCHTAVLGKVQRSHYQNKLCTSPLQTPCVADSKIHWAHVTLTFELYARKWVGVTVLHTRENISFKFEVSMNFCMGPSGIVRERQMDGQHHWLTLPPTWHGCKLCAWLDLGHTS